MTPHRVHGRERPNPCPKPGSGLQGTIPSPRPGGGGGQERPSLTDRAGCPAVGLPRAQHQGGAWKSHSGKHGESRGPGRTSHVVSGQRGSDRNPDIWTRGRWGSPAELPVYTVVYQALRGKADAADPRQGSNPWSYGNHRKLWWEVSTSETGSHRRAHPSSLSAPGPAAPRGGGTLPGRCWPGAPLCLLAVRSWTGCLPSR